MKNQLISLYLVILAIVSCKPKEIIKYQVRTVTQTSIDSVYINRYDSIVMRTVKDSVFITKYKYITKEKYSLKRDTVSLKDSVYYNVVKTVKVEKQLNWFQRSFLFLGKLLSAIFIIIALYYTIKHLYKNFL